MGNGHLLPQFVCIVHGNNGQIESFVANYCILWTILAFADIFGTILAFADFLGTIFAFADILGTILAFANSKNRASELYIC